jgi:putative component of membrane protein insertase Oxa1/YidC/SpoIIIJ protein YidD
MMRYAAVASITAYQKHLSTYKGFCCAYRHQTGRYSCSEFAKRVAVKYGIAVMFRILPRQLTRCKAAYQSVTITSATSAKNQDRTNKEKIADSTVTILMFAAALICQAICLNQLRAKPSISAMLAPAIVRFNLTIR